MSKGILLLTGFYSPKNLQQKEKVKFLTLIKR